MFVTTTGRWPLSRAASEHRGRTADVHQRIYSGFLNVAVALIRSVRTVRPCFWALQLCNIAVVGAAKFVCSRSSIYTDTLQTTKQSAAQTRWPRAAQQTSSLKLRNTRSTSVELAIMKKKVGMAVIATILAGTRLDVDASMYSSLQLTYLVDIVGSDVCYVGRQGQFLEFCFESADRMQHE